MNEGIRDERAELVQKTRQMMRMFHADMLAQQGIDAARLPADQREAFHNIAKLLSRCATQFGKNNDMNVWGYTITRDLYGNDVRTPDQTYADTFVHLAKIAKSDPNDLNSPSIVSLTPHKVRVPATPPEFVRMLADFVYRDIIPPDEVGEGGEPPEADTEDDQDDTARHESPWQSWQRRRAEEKARRAHEREQERARQEQQREQQRADADRQAREAAAREAQRPARRFADALNAAANLEAIEHIFQDIQRAYAARDTAPENAFSDEEYREAFLSAQEAAAQHFDGEIGRAEYPSDLANIIKRIERFYGNNFVEARMFKESAGSRFGMRPRLSEALRATMSPEQIMRYRNGKMTPKFDGPDAVETGKIVARLAEAIDARRAAIVQSERDNSRRRAR